MAMLEFARVTKSYGEGRDAHVVLREVDLAVEEASFSVVTAPSGGGKSTLLALALGLKRPDSGAVRIAGRDIARLRTTSIPYLRRNIGMIGQDCKLLLDAPPFENVALALEVLGLRRREVRARTRAALERVGLDSTVQRPVRCLSGGEQQRVAIARALAGRPALVLADEPTAHLDAPMTHAILNLLADVRQDGTTVVLATRSPRVASFIGVTARFELTDGRLTTMQACTVAAPTHPVGAVA